MLRRYTRVSARAAHYTPAGGIEKCGACRFYMPPAFCGRLTDPVSPQGWCRFFSREMVQRWQPGTPGMGGSAIPPGASLDLDFTTPGTLDPRIVFTRASTATYFNSAGVMQTAASNAPRWDYDPVTHALRGLLIEEARTNIALNSGNLAVAPWVPLGLTSAAPSVVANAAASPDGTTTATQVNYPNTATGGVSSINNNITVTAAIYTFSVWARGVVGGETIWLGVTPDAVTYYRVRMTLTTAWQRFTVTTGTLTAATWVMILGVDMRDSSQTAQPAQSVYLWGAQVELGAFPTSYIPTTAAAVTRAADACSAAVGAWYNATQGSLFIDYMLEGYAGGYGAPLELVGSNANTDYIDADEQTTSGQPPPMGNVAGGAIAVAGAVNSYSGFTLYPTIQPGGLYRGASSWAVGGLFNAAHNATLATTNGVAVPSLPTIVQLTVGGTMHYQPQLCLWARHARYWPRALSASELQSVTL